MSRPNPNLAKAFTLIELLVVIAIIAILAAILFPVFSQAKQAAKQSACLSQQHQIGVAVLLYLNDYDDRYPQEHPSSSDPATDDNLGQLESTDYGSPFDKILPYTGSGTNSATVQLYVCPADSDPHGKTLLDPNGNCKDSNPLGPPPGPLTSELLNAYFLFGATESAVTEPAQTLYISERRDSFCDVHYHPWLGETIAPTGANDTANPIAISFERHHGGSNGVFADGHSKWESVGAMAKPFTGHELYGQFQAF